MLSLLCISFQCILRVGMRIGFAFTVIYLSLLQYFPYFCFGDMPALHPAACMARINKMAFLPVYRILPISCLAGLIALNKKQACANECDENFLSYRLFTMHIPCRLQFTSNIGSGLCISALLKYLCRF